VCYAGTTSPTEVRLEYQSLDRLELDRGSVPESLPTPKEPIWPFGGLTDYMRIVGPGMFVGRGWKQADGVTDNRKGSGFLHFVLIRVD
jgi:hypothetical protein